MGIKLTIDNKYVYILCNVERNIKKFNLKNGVEMSNEEFSTAGGNNSQIHVDFMIGSDQMNVDGINKNGDSEPVMRNGEWAFEV